MSAQEPTAVDTEAAAAPRLSMGQLLASCAAASAVSTPPVTDTDAESGRDDGAESRRGDSVESRRGDGAGTENGAPLPARDAA